MFTESFQQTKARDILGGNFLGIPEVIQYYGYRPSASECKALENVPFAPQFLWNICPEFLLVAGCALNLLEIRNAQRHVFASRKSWYDRNIWQWRFSTEPFATTRMQTGWYLFPAEPDVTPPFRTESALPSMAEAAFALVLHAGKNGKRPFYEDTRKTSKRYATRDRTSWNAMVSYVFDDRGLHIEYEDLMASNYGDPAASLLGLAKVSKAA